MCGHKKLGKVGEMEHKSSLKSLWRVRPVHILDYHYKIDNLNERIWPGSTLQILNAIFQQRTYLERKP